VKLRDRLAKLNRLQQSRLFKIIATVAIVIISISTFVTYFVAKTAPGSSGAEAQTSARQVVPKLDQEQIDALSDIEKTQYSALQASQRAVEEILRARSDWKSVGFGIAVVSVLALTVVWLGVGLTYLGLLLLAGAIGWPLLSWEATAGIGRIFLGVIALTAAFTALLQLLRLLLSHPDPVSSIARVMLDEAVRMKISLVFIVILILGLSALPNALNADQPLRYRVQSFMSFSTGLSFWTIAVLTLLFSAASVTGEQREKIIWQTMTKPVSPWKYILGKWLGVSALNAVLLAVCASGIFLFVEYMRGQPALGEREAYVAMGNQDLTEDRLILETQVLTSRIKVQPDVPWKKTDPEFLKAADDFIKNRQAQDKRFGATEAERAKVIDDLYKSSLTEHRSIEPGRSEQFVFHGLAPAKKDGKLLLFRYRINAGTNRPDDFYMVSFLFTDGMVMTKRMGAGYYHSDTIYPSAIYTVTDEDRARATTPELKKELESLDGALILDVYNGDYANRTTNKDTIIFPPDGLEISYAVGSYRLNFLRAMIILWIKLCFLSIIAIWAATFLSFPVACIVAIGVFLAAEGSHYLLTSLDTFATTDRDGNIKLLSTVAAGVTRVVGGLFALYGDLKPTKRLVQGELIPVRDVLVGAAALALASSVMYVGAVLTMMKRELATYSGR